MYFATDDRRWPYVGFHGTFRVGRCRVQATYFPDSERHDYCDLEYAWTRTLEFLHSPRLERTRIGCGSGNATCMRPSGFRRLTRRPERPAMPWDRPVMVEQVASIREELVRRVSPEPGLVPIAVANALAGTTHATRSIQVEKLPRAEDARAPAHLVRVARVDVDYLEALGQSVVQGCDFTTVLNQGTRLDLPLLAIVLAPCWVFVFRSRRANSARIRSTSACRFSGDLRSSVFTPR